MGNLGLQNKNPGNLRDPNTGNFQVFENAGDGYNALVGDLEYKKGGKSRHIQPGGSILDLANVWAPASDGNIPENWAKNVANTVGTDINARWDTIPTDQLAKGIQVAEGTSTMSVGQAPSGNLSSSNSITGKNKLTREQMTANIEAMEKQGASQEEIQGYLDSLKENSGPIGTTPGDTLGEMLVDNSVTKYVGDKYNDGTIGDITKTGFNRVSQPFKDVFATPIQAGVAGWNKLNNKWEGGEVADPYGATNPMPQFKTKNDPSGNTKINPISDVKGKLGSAIEVAVMVSPLIKSLMAGRALTKSLLHPAIVENLPVGMKAEKFLKLPKIQQANILGDMYKTAEGLKRWGDAPKILKAAEKLKGTSGLLRKAAILAKDNVGKTVMGGLGLSQVFDLYKRLKD